VSRERSEGPIVSVIVTSYGRERFLPSALRSVLGQTIKASRIEILLLTDFEPTGLPREGEVRLRRLSPGPGGQGQWMLQALRECKGEVVTFLDDDDLYAPDRLAELASVFEHHPEVGYYRNAIAPFEQTDDRERPLPVREGRWKVPKGRLPLRQPIPPAARNSRVVARLWQSDQGFNLSSMAVRKSSLESVASWLPRVRQAASAFLFYASVLGSQSLWLDDTPRTWYRLHEENWAGRSGPAWWMAWRRAVRVGSLLDEDARLLTEFVEVSRPEREWTLPIQATHARHQLLRGLSETDSPRSRRWHEWHDWVACAHPVDPLADLPFYALSCTGLARPAWTADLFRWGVRRTHGSAPSQRPASVKIR
jgi:hypothetical protein